LIAAKTVFLRYTGASIDLDKQIEKQIEKSKRIMTTNSETGVVVEGLSNPQIKLAACCYPINGDPIVGFISKGKGIVVHREDCKNLDIMEKDRRIKLFWANDITRKYPCILKISSLNKNGLVAEIVNVLNSLNVMIMQLNFASSKDIYVSGKIKILINSATELNNLIVNLQKVEGIYKVERS